jgi:hypothetical protein
MRTVISGFKHTVVILLGGAQLLHCRSIAFEVKVNTDQRGTLEVPRDQQLTFDLSHIEMR